MAWAIPNYSQQKKHRTNKKKMEGQTQMTSEQAWTMYTLWLMMMT
jgi:hypothetical protein